MNHVYHINIIMLVAGNIDKCTKKLLKFVKKWDKIYVHA